MSYDTFEVYQLVDPEDNPTDIFGEYWGDLEEKGYSIRKLKVKVIEVLNGQD